MSVVRSSYSFFIATTFITKKSLVGIYALVKIVAIGKEQKDLTTFNLNPHWPKILSGKACLNHLMLNVVAALRAIMEKNDVRKNQNLLT